MLIKKAFYVFTILLLMGFTWFKYDNLDEGIKPYPRLSDTTRIKTDLTTITRTEHPRNYRHKAILDTVAAYIQSEFLKETPSVSEQKFKAKNGVEYKNIIASFGPKDAERIIIGAHYDVCGDQEGADDNASGTAGLLELARLLKN